jgi:hypothetical protein
MNHTPQLIVMLTHHDQTVSNAYEIFHQCKDAKAQMWGFKEIGIPSHQMKALFSYMKACGKTTVLEVVAYTQEECLKGAQTALDCGCDILMGTLFYDSVNDFCKSHGLKYMPFLGQVEDRPSVLKGSIESMIQQAETYLEKGVYGFDLLGYRYVGDPRELNLRLTANIPAPICIAGSINSFNRLDEIKAVAPWSFTIGGAFFENRFGGTFLEQINKVCDYIAQK